jgi:DNA-binding PadR family transcriptional regulator
MPEDLFQGTLEMLVLKTLVLERAGRIKAEWRAGENNRRVRYYLHTCRGRKTFEEERAQWDRQIAAINRILQA